MIKFFPDLDQVTQFLTQNAEFTESFKISREVRAKQTKSIELNERLMTLIRSIVTEIDSIQNQIYKSKHDYNVAYAEYNDKMNKILYKNQPIPPETENDSKPEGLLPDEGPFRNIVEPKSNPEDPQTNKTHTIILPQLANLTPVPTKESKDPEPEDTSCPIALMGSIIRPSRPTINSNPFHPNNFDSKTRKLELVHIVDQFAKEGCFMEKGPRDLADFLSDYLLLNNFVYDSFEESLPRILAAAKTLLTKVDRALGSLRAKPETESLAKQTRDIFTFDKCDQLTKSARKKLKIIGSKILKILEKSTSPNWETSIETVKEILAESDYIFKAKVRGYSRKYRRCLEVRSICKILRKIHNKRTLEVKVFEDTKRKVLGMIEQGSMEVEFNADNSLNQTKRDHLNLVLGNTQVAHLLTDVLEKLDKEGLLGQGNGDAKLEDMDAMEKRRKAEKLGRMQGISLGDLEYTEFQSKIAHAVSGEFKTRKLPFINFQLLGRNPEADMVRQVVETYFQKKSQALENKAQHKVNLFFYLDYKKETAQYFRDSGDADFSFKPRPISFVEKLFACAMTLSKDPKVEYFLFNTFSKVADVLSLEKQKSLIGKRGELTENHEILGLLFSDEYQQMAFREKEWLASLEYAFKKIAELDVSEIMYSEPSRQNSSQGTRRKESVSTVKGSEMGFVENVESSKESPPEAPVLVLPDSKHCGSLLSLSRKPSDIIKRISEKIEKLNEFLDNLNMMAMLYNLESRTTGLKQTIREADLKKIKDFVHNYEWAGNNVILQFSQKRTEQLLKVHNNLRYLLNTINVHTVNLEDQPVKPSKGPNGKVLSFQEFMRKVDSGKTGWINLWDIESNKKDYNKCLKKFVKIKVFKHVFPEKISQIKMFLRSHKDLRKDVKEFTLSLKLETERDEKLYQAIKEKYWEFRHRFIQTPFYSEELHAVLSQFELVFLLFSVYNEPLSLKNIVGFENLLRETGYDKLKISACGIFMDREVEKLTAQLKKIERCFCIAQSGVFFGSQIKDFDQLDFQTCGIRLKDSLDLESYLRLSEQQGPPHLNSNLTLEKLPTCRIVFLVNSISEISVLVKRALCFKDSFEYNCHVEKYAGLLFKIYRKLHLESHPLFQKLFGPEHKGK